MAYFERARLVVNQDSTVSSFSPIVVRGMVMIIEQWDVNYIVLKVHKSVKHFGNKRYLIVNEDRIGLSDLIRNHAIPLNDLDLSLNRHCSFHDVSKLIMQWYDEWLVE